jgi:hypothetical protein
MKASILAHLVLYFAGISAAFAGGAPPTNAERGPAGITVGEHLLVARYRLIEQGWQPIRMHATDGYEYSGVERQLAARKFFEVDVCSFDSSRCILFYARHGTCLRVDTLGEQLDDMTVTRWTDECPDGPAEPDQDGVG